MRYPWLLLTLLSCGCSRQVSFAERTVIVLVTDGVRLEDSFAGTFSSALDAPDVLVYSRLNVEMVARGAQLTQAWNTGYTVTTPAHAELLAGRRLPFANYELNGFPGLYRPDLPSVLAAVRDQQEVPREQVSLIANTTLLQPLGHSIYPEDGYISGADWLFVSDETTNVPSWRDADVLDTILVQLAAHPSSLILANLHQVDRSAHYGDEDAYPRDLRNFNNTIPDFYQGLQELGIADTTWLFLLSDHGRHDISETEPVWRDHGCDCNGCRRIPLLVLGPDIQAGIRSDEPVLLADVGATVASILGVELPWADGLVLDEIFEGDPSSVQREGIAEVALTEGHVAEVRYLDDRAHRSAVYLDDQLMSSPDAIQAEAPVLASDPERGLAALCFRELVLQPESPRTPWRARCFTSQGESWSAQDPETVNVGPFWEPAMLYDPEGTLHLVYPWNPNGTVGGGAEEAVGRVGVRVARLEESGFSFSEASGVGSFPIDTSARFVEDELVVAFGAGKRGSGARDTRDVITLRKRVGGRGIWSLPTRAELGGLMPDSPLWRLEHPALQVDQDGSLLLAAVGVIDKQILPVMARSTDQGQSWESAWIPELPGEPLPHLSPIWMDGRSVWAMLDPLGEGAQICWQPPEGEPSCQDAGSDRVLEMAAWGSELRVVVDQGSARWRILSLTEP